MDLDNRRAGERTSEPRAPAGRAPAAGAPSGLAFAGLGFQFAAALVVSFYLGQWLDRRFGTSPVLLLACVLLGAGGGFYGLYRQLMGAQRRAAERARSAGGGPGTRA